MTPQQLIRYLLGRGETPDDDDSRVWNERQRVNQYIPFEDQTRLNQWLIRNNPNVTPKYDEIRAPDWKVDTMRDYQAGLRGEWEDPYFTTRNRNPYTLTGVEGGRTQVPLNYEPPEPEPRESHPIEDEWSLGEDDNGTFFGGIRGLYGGYTGPIILTGEDERPSIKDWGRSNVPNNVQIDEVANIFDRWAPKVQGQPNTGGSTPFNVFGRPFPIKPNPINPRSIRSAVSSGDALGPPTPTPPGLFESIRNSTGIKSTRGRESQPSVKTLAANRLGGRYGK